MVSHIYTKRQTLRLLVVHLYRLVVQAVGKRHATLHRAVSVSLLVYWVQLVANLVGIVLCYGYVHKTQGDNKQ